MSKNICIFSDGTGQGGGMNPTNWTNVYRLYDATRDVAPDRQLCFYDPGLGADPDEGEQRSVLHRARDWLAQATGYGITDNIIDCYTALMLAYEPGDKVFLFGFSRGAYTVRSVGGAMALCGVPKNLPKVSHWKEFRDIDDTAARKLATEAVTRVYQEPDADRRQQAADRFRDQHGSSELPPYFVGVWDTVKALGIKGISDIMPGRHTFNNDRLNDKVAYGRQALAIDENRKTFKPELWDERDAPQGQIKQHWFAGVHTDIGGGYGLGMGLSDITLAWMVDEATQAETPLLLAPSLRQSLKPDPLGQQHDQRQTSRIPWQYGTREAAVDSAYLSRPVTTTPHVKTRFDEKQVMVLKTPWCYRPVALKAHPAFTTYYDPPPA